MKVKYHQLSEVEKKKYLGDFYKIISSLHGYDETKNFFKDLLTLSETVMIARRIQIAELLLSGATYDAIRERLGVGYHNITQVERWLNNGFGGFMSALKRFKQKKETVVERTMPSPYDWEWVRRKYPTHFMLLNLLLDNKKKNKK